MATPRVAAGALFVDDSGRVLLVRPSYKRHWDVPGGYVEPGESPLAACVREVREELGLALTIGGLLVVDWAPAEGEGDKLLFLFDGGTLTAGQLAGVHLQATELVEYAFHHLADAQELLIPRLSRRLAEALAARSDGLPRYLEHGATPWTVAPVLPETGLAPSRHRRPGG